MIVDLFVNNLSGFVSSMGYWGIFILMALESTMFPLPSEIVMPFAGFLVATAAFGFWTVLTASTLGCLAGSILSYYLGYHGGVPFVKKFGKYFLINENHMKKSEEWFAKKGGITILIGRFIPGIRHVISIPAGVSKMNVLEFSTFTLIGAGIWNAILIGIGYLLEKNWGLVYHYAEYVDLFIVFILAIALIYYITSIISERRKRK